MAQGAASKPLTKSEIFGEISEATGLGKKEVVGVFEALAKLIGKELAKGKRTDPKQFTIPGLCKIVTKFKPATKERKGIDPFTKEERIFKAKPAQQQVKVRPLKGLKDMVV